MKYYTWCYPDEKFGDVIVAMSEDDIIDEYWEYWSESMIELGRHQFVSVKNCIDDWVVAHWAEEVDYDLYMFYK